MRQAPQVPEKQNEYLLRNFLVFLLTASLIACGLMLSAGRPAKEGALTTMQEVILQKTASAREKKQNYALVMEESGPGYSLRFNGQVSNGYIHGKLDGYDLEIYTDQEQYLIRGSGVFAEWEEIEAARLEALSVMIREPLSLLELLLSEKQVLTEIGPERLVENAICQTYFLEIPPPDIRLLTRFEEEASLDKLQLYLWFAEEEQFMYRMAVLLYITVDGESMQISRIYNLSPNDRGLPEGLPRFDEAIIAI